MRKPCRSEEEPACPWRRDSSVGAFPPDAFRHSAETAYDQGMHEFACHTASTVARPVVCAGYLLRGANHNIAARMANRELNEVSSPVELYADYRSMAIANGVPPDDPRIAPCLGPDESPPVAQRLPAPRVQWILDPQSTLPRQM